MIKKEPKLPGYSWLSPYLLVADVEAAIKFYQSAFGFDKKEAIPGPDGNLLHAELTYQGQTLMTGKAGTYKDTKTPKQSGVESPVTLYVYCDDVDKFYENAMASGAINIQAPEDMFWGDRTCVLQDPDGYNWCFATHTGKMMDIAATQI